VRMCLLLNLNRWPLICEEQLQAMKEARSKKRIPQTLAVLSIKAFALHSTRFVDIPDCPLKYLRELNNMAMKHLF
jgi:hypothetical protein